MRNEERLAELKRVQAKADAIREKLGISSPGTTLYQAYLYPADDDLIVVEADGFGGATARVVEGNYPVDYYTWYEKPFETEEEAELAADALYTGKASPTQILGDPG